MKKDDCIFCKIAAGEIPSRKAYEDDEILAFHTGKTQLQIHDDTDRDKILGAEEAVAYGLVDQIMHRRKPTAVPG